VVPTTEAYLKERLYYRGGTLKEARHKGSTKDAVFGKRLASEAFHKDSA
jgi:hypothetical protein